MSSFFTTPASQKKRKRADAAPASSTKRRSTTTRGGARPPATNGGRQGRRDAERDDEDISSSESGSEGESDALEEDAGSVAESSSGDEDETAAERRLRLAERYLENIREEVDPAGFDAADVDREYITGRLQEDVAEAKGKVYRHIASQLDVGRAEYTTFRADQNALTGIAAAPPYVYTVAKDLSICKWELPDLEARKTNTQTNISVRRKPKLVKTFKGYHSSARKNPKWIGHTATILCIAVSSSGKFLATGGADKKLVVWDAVTLKPLKIFHQHRDTVLSVSFRRNTHQLYSASADRTIKIWSLDELTYVETLFGHQDQVVDIVGLAGEKCISVGARDRTARYWKVIEESQLVFRGGSGGSSKDPAVVKYTEGSMDRVAMIDEETFVTGSDNGTLSLWNILRKKALHTISLAHGTEPLPKAEDVSAEKNPEDRRVDGRPTARWITALATVPYSDFILSGSWDGYIRAWKVSEDKRRLEKVGIIAAPGSSITSATIVGHNGSEGTGPIRGLINGINVFEIGERGKDGVCVVAAVSKEHRLGQWSKLPKGRNEAAYFEIPRLALDNGAIVSGATEQT